MVVLIGNNVLRVSDNADLYSSLSNQNKSDIQKFRMIFVVDKKFVGRIFLKLGKRRMFFWIFGYKFQTKPRQNQDKN